MYPEHVGAWMPRRRYWYSGLLPWGSEVEAAVEVRGHVRPGQLVDGEAMSRRQGERAARPHRYLQRRFLFPATFLQFAHGLVEVAHTIDEDRAVAFQVIGQEDVRRPVRELDLRHPRAHAFDTESEPAPEHLGEVARVGRDVAAGCVEIVELLER